MLFLSNTNLQTIHSNNLQIKNKFQQFVNISDNRSKHNIMRYQDRHSLHIAKQQFNQTINQPHKQEEINLYKPQISPYSSLLCRNGPVPQKYNKFTDPFCLILYVSVSVLMIAMIFAHGFTFNISTQTDQMLAQSDLIYATKTFLIHIQIAALAMLVLGMVFSLLSVFIPKIMAVFAIVLLLILSALISVTKIYAYFSQLQTNHRSYLFVGIVSLLMFSAAALLIVRRRQKIFKLGRFLQLSSTIIKPHICMVFTPMVILSLIEMATWYFFVTLYAGVSEVSNQNKFLHFLMKLIVVLMWLWTSGFHIAISDYFITFFTIQWFYDVSKYDQNVEMRNQINQSQSIDDKVKQFLSYRQKSSQIRSKICKKMFYQSGTLIFGAILAYLPLYVIAKIRHFLAQSKWQSMSIFTLSKYCYFNTILECNSFVLSNRRIFQFRQRIKLVIPQLYMMGHFFADIMKLAFLLIGVIAFHFFVQNDSDILKNIRRSWSGGVVILFFTTGLALQIATNFANIIGKCGDIAFFLYCLDLQIERVHFSSNTNYSTPQSLINIIKNLLIKRKIK